VTLRRIVQHVTVISVVHTKGGVGKTTSAVFLATAAARQGRDVALVDADPQGSASEWAAEAAAGAEPFPFPVVSAARPLSVPGHDLVLVDTPPGTARAIEEGIDAANLVLVPCGPSPLDVRRVWPTLQITAHRPTAVLLTAIDLRTRLADEVRAVLDAEGVPLVATPIVRREAIRRAYGTTPSYLHGYDDVLTELMEAMQHV